MEDIREQFGIIRAYEGKIPNIEVDLILSNIRNIYESFLQVDKLNQPVIAFSIEKEKSKTVPVEAETEVETEAEAEAEIEVETEAEAEIEAETEVETEVETEAETEIEAEIEIEPQPKPQTQPQPDPVPRPEPIPQPDPVPQPEPEPLPEPQPQPTAAGSGHVKTTLDLFGESSSTLADRLKDNSEKRVADKLKPEKINDIKGAIGINEKFLFINELFDGSLKSYEDAISKLNSCVSSFQAERVLDELRNAFGWDHDNSTAASFIDLVNRKF